MRNTWRRIISRGSGFGARGSEPVVLRGSSGRSERLFAPGKHRPRSPSPEPRARGFATLRLERARQEPLSLSVPEKQPRQDQRDAREGRDQRQTDQQGNQIGYVAPGDVVDVDPG